MKWLLLFSGFLLLTVTSVDAQRIRLFRSIIHTSQGERIDGILYDVTDSTVLYVTDSPKSIKQLQLDNPIILSFPLTDINRIAITRRRPLRTANRVVFGLSAVGSLAVLTIPNTGGSWGDVLYRVAFRPFLLVLLPLYAVAAMPRSAFFPRKIIRFNEARNGLADARTALLPFAYHPKLTIPELQKPVTTTQP